MDREAFPLLPAVLLAVCLLTGVPTAAAAKLSYSLTHVGGDTWEYRYTLTHDGTPPWAPIEAFAIGFDPALYNEPSLEITTPVPLSTQWDERLLASSLVLNAFYDVEALAGGIAEGESTNGFSVRVEWLGAGIPGAQNFWIFSPGNPNPVQQGQTRLEAPESIPVGGLWVSGLLVLVLVFAAGNRLRAGRG